MPHNRSQQPQDASHTFTRHSVPISDDLYRLLLLWRSQLSCHRGQVLGLALLCVNSRERHLHSSRSYGNFFGIAEELSSDGGPEFTAALTQQFLRDWGVAHRLSSVAYPHSNTRAEIGVKSAKRVTMENTGTQGDVDIPAFQRAMLTYRNTRTSLDNRSPAEIVFGRQIRDFMPVMPGKYVPCDTWTDTAANREKALMERHAKEAEALLPHTKKMPPLKVGNSVRIQNQTGNAPRRWDKSGQVVEVRQND